MEPVADWTSSERLRGATLFFVPYAGVTPMFAQACVVAQHLKEPRTFCAVLRVVFGSLSGAP